MINGNAPIIPFEGMGNIRLYATINELSDVLSMPNTTLINLNNGWIRYDISDLMMLFFHPKNNKLFKICTQAGYKGKLFGKIGTNTRESDFTKIDSQITYDDFEEIWESPKGYFVETDVETGAAVWITVFIKELYDDDFESANW